MLKNPLVSIVIPVYNGSKYLSEAIDSALAQTYKNFEVIIVNDGSNDNGKTERIAKSYGKKIIYFKKKNGGVGSALNYGIKKMRGEWFSWLSHDDIYLPNKLAEQIRFLNSHPNANFIFSAYENIDEHGEVLLQPGKDWVPGPEPQFRQLLEGNKFSGCATLIHKSCFVKTGLFNEKNRLSQDYEMWIKMAYYFKLFRCPGILVRRRIHPDMGSINSRKEHRFSTLKMMKRIDSQISIQNVFPDVLSGSSTHQQIALCHVKLAEIFMKNWHTDLANKHYRLSYKLWPSWRNPAFIRNLLGANLFHLRSTLLRYYWEAEINLSMVSHSLKLRALRI
jgi:hypothetical protein